jgi:adenine-specific DNA-methyltransferase
MLVEGDNLDALKLLQATHAARVRLAYIDPPYNTGKDFVYPDSSDHSAWLSMMYPRLLLARELLSPEGVIFVSLDDNEAPNLRLMADEIFGEQNFIATICHKARASVSNDRIISINHNLIALYARDKAAVFARRAEFGLEPELDPAAFPFEDERGRYRLVPVDGPGGAAKGNPFYAFEGVSGHFRYAESTMREKWNAGLIVKVGQCLQQKYYLAAAAATRRTDTTWWDERLYTATATSRLNALMGCEVFKSPKPTGLVRRMLRLWSRGDGDLVLDFFAGSGTTGHAVLEQNAEDGVRRHYLLVQSPELLHERNPHQCEAAAFCDRLGKPRVLTELTKERLRRAAQRVRQEHPQTGTDTGFRVFTCFPATERFERNQS